MSVRVTKPDYDVSFVFSSPKAPSVYVSIKDDDKPTLVNPEWVAYNVKAVRAARKQGGRILVLTNSFVANSKIAEALRDDGMPVIEQTRQTMSDICANLLAENPDGIFVSPSAWEGFDLDRRTGPDGLPAKIRHVIVTQVPFGTPDGSLENATLKYLAPRVDGLSKANSILLGEIFDKAIRKFRQAFDCGIRGANDSFTFWMTDPRFPRSKSAGEYKFFAVRSNSAWRFKAFRDALPEWFILSADYSRWDTGAMLDVDGTLIPFSEMEEVIYP